MKIFSYRLVSDYTLTVRLGPSVKTDHERALSPKLVIFGCFAVVYGFILVSGSYLWFIVLSGFLFKHMWV